MHDIIDTAVAAGSCHTLAATVNGAMVDISVQDGVHLNGASKVVTTDIACTNGVIHVIDTVLMPPEA
jgi:uncharacterized surface protein with fasciclin (FAS1) repeats